MEGYDPNTPLTQKTQPQNTKMSVKKEIADFLSIFQLIISVNNKDDIKK